MRLPLCHCGQPIHYSNNWDEAAMIRSVKYFGEYLLVTVPPGITYKVQRHYIALHGIKAWELDKLGFEIVSHKPEGEEVLNANRKGRLRQRMRDSKAHHKR